MRNYVMATVASLFVVASLPAQATLADRKSDETHFEEAQPAPYGGQTVIRGEIQDRVAESDPAQPSPYSGRVVIRGEVKSENQG